MLIKNRNMRLRPASPLGIIKDAIEHPAKLGRRPWRLDLLLFLFFYQEKKRKHGSRSGTSQNKKRKKEQGAQAPSHKADQRPTDSAITIDQRTGKRPRFELAAE